MARCYIGKRHASNAPASLSFNISRFVTPAVPPTGADANGLSWSVRTAPRAGCRHQPNRKTKSRRSDVAICSFAAASNITGLRSLPKALLLGGGCWFVGAASEPLLPHHALERRWPAL
jgi:hypothetical protein